MIILGTSKLLIALESLEYTQQISSSQTYLCEIKQNLRLRICINETLKGHGFNSRRM